MQFNGRIGRIGGWDEEKERYKIKLEKEESVVLLRTTNVALIGGTRNYTLQYDSAEEVLTIRKQLLLIIGVAGRH